MLNSHNIIVHKWYQQTLPKLKLHWVSTDTISKRNAYTNCPTNYLRKKIQKPLVEKFMLSINDINIPLAFTIQIRNHL